MSDWATAPFAVIYVHYLATAITNFTNHDYLFALISVVMAAHANSRTRAVQYGVRRVSVRVWRGDWCTFEGTISRVC